MQVTSSGQVIPGSNPFVITLKLYMQSLEYDQINNFPQNGMQLIGNMSSQIEKISNQIAMVNEISKQIALGNEINNQIAMVNEISNRISMVNETIYQIRANEQVSGQKGFYLGMVIFSFIELLLLLLLLLWIMMMTNTKTASSVDSIKRVQPLDN